MREYKFRAWDKTTEAWLKEICVTIDGNGKIFLFKEHYPQNENIVIQLYTGLKDKNKKDIYEGDILESIGKPYWDVIFRKGCFYLRNDEKKVEWSKCFDGIFFPHYKIIGNIYENPSLLNTKQ
jgi:uncharacterized phage protein (TIGR01671 family)